MQTATRPRKTKSVPIFEASYTIDGAVWVPGCGKTERPTTTRSGRNIIYGWQPETGDHRYLDLDANTVLPVIFDPAKDGTADDPLLLHPIDAHFIINALPSRVTVLLVATAPAPGFVYYWRSEIDFARFSGLIPSDFLNEERRTLSEDQLQAQLAGLRAGSTGDLTCKVPSRSQAIDIVGIAARSHRHTNRTELRIRPVVFSTICELARLSGGKTDHLIHVMDLLKDQPAQQPSPYNW